MNQCFLTGIVAEAPVLLVGKDGVPHAVFHLCVAHRTGVGVIRRELYPVNVWRKTAQWAQAHLRKGERVAVQGYLTQRTVRGATPETRIEVTAEEFLTVPLYAQKPDLDNASAATDGINAAIDKAAFAGPYDLLPEDYMTNASAFPAVAGERG